MTVSHSGKGRFNEYAFQARQSPTAERCLALLEIHFLHPVTVRPSAPSTASASLVEIGGKIVQRARRSCSASGDAQRGSSGTRSAILPAVCRAREI